MPVRYPCSNNKSEWKLDSGAIARGNSSTSRNIPAPKPAPPAGSCSPGPSRSKTAAESRRRKKERRGEAGLLRGESVCKQVSIGPLVATGAPVNWSSREPVDGN
ncbi:hypothetical protein WN51_00098 [Melipona quadrifasciata]|uniref:Uncharacterized protein n=1 Tax=Melipona quadrifasciata TaxID=166423 RepID=A0A0N0BL04_9HYME|nr:hypothetical protein WN51_00098 [Melipona quadrifasciata]